LFVGPTKSDKSLLGSVSTFSQVDMLPWHYETEMLTCRNVHASAQYGEYNEKFGNVTMQNRLNASLGVIAKI